MNQHSHCPAITCYWRIQYSPTCSRCGGATVQTPGCCEPGARRQYLDTDDE